MYIILSDLVKMCKFCSKEGNDYYCSHKEKSWHEDYKQKCNPEYCPFNAKWY